MDQLLTCLRFYATGGHLSTISDFMGTHVATSSRIIKNVSIALASLSHAYIKMPTENNIQKIQRDFYNIALFPSIVGCIDGTHIKIQSPGGEEGEIFRNRKGYFSINVQVVGDSDLKVQDIVARWPGSTHDMTIYSNSRIRARLEGGEFRNGIILGDSGYGVGKYLLTPLQNPETAAEKLYNKAHITTRNSVERLFGVWKRRFPILAYGIRLKLATAYAVIVASAVLHNISISMHEEEPPEPDINADEFENLIQVGNIPEVINGDNI
ncbi:putative nuclease HARBI1 [Onthophagus taurus]|uniref:putative nuclease HARBI1 n=1 Tax=Onthophagus taurus TaxID=166361 RepID=UPI0039BE18EE